MDMDVVAMLGLLDAIVKFADDDTLVHGNVVLSAGFNENNAVLHLNMKQPFLDSDKHRLALMSYGENRFALMNKCVRAMGAKVSLEESEDGQTTVVIRLSNKVHSLKGIRETSRSEENRAVFPAPSAQPDSSHRRRIPSLSAAPSITPFLRLPCRPYQSCETPLMHPGCDFSPAACP